MIFVIGPLNLVMYCSIHGYLLTFPKHLKISQKFTQNCQIVDNVISIGIWRRLKRDRDIGRKAVLSDVKTAFTFTPALINT